MKTLIKIVSNLFLHLLNKWKEKADKTETPIDNIICNNCIKCVKDLQQELNK